MTPTTVLTCAHVVQGSEPGTLTVSFPQRPDLGGLPATVAVYGGWRGGTTDPGDLAVLQLARDVPPAPARFAPPLDAERTLPELALEAYGFPEGYDEGQLAWYDDPYDGLDDEPPPTYRTIATFEFADGPRHPDTVAALGRAVTRLLTASGLAPDGYELTATDRGWSVETARDVPGLPLLHATVAHFESEVVHQGGRRWLVTFSCVSDDGLTETPDPVAVRRTLDASEDRRGIVAVPQTLRDELDEDPDLAPWLQSLRPGTDAGWYRLCRPAHALFDGTHSLPPVLGPYPLPSGDVFPEGTGETRAVVHRSDAGEAGLTRRPGVTEYFEVDLTERRLHLDETESSFRATGTAIWRVSDPLQAVVHSDAASFLELIRELVRGRLRHLASTRPDAASGSRLSLAPMPADAVPGCTFRWDLTITRTRP
ncbi:hypothetical protein ACWCQS_27140 [Streptomyces sp. NPDC002076]